MLVARAERASKEDCKIYRGPARLRWRRRCRSRRARANTPSEPMRTAAAPVGAYSVPDKSYQGDPAPEERLVFVIFCQSSSGADPVRRASRKGYDRPRDCAAARQGPPWNPITTSVHVGRQLSHFSDSSLTIGAVTTGLGQCWTPSGGRRYAARPVRGGVMRLPARRAEAWSTL